MGSPRLFISLSYGAPQVIIDAEQYHQYAEWLEKKVLWWPLVPEIPIYQQKKYRHPMQDYYEDLNQ
jgi:hypothetical protein